MKLLLVNPPENIGQKQSRFIGAGRIVSRTRCLPSLGLLILAAATRQKGIETYLIDAHAEGLSEAQIKERINKIAPDLIGVTATTPTLFNALEILRLAKELNPKIKTVLGGPHLTVLPQTVRLPEIDFGIAGAGEKSLPELCLAIKNKESLEKIPGLVRWIDNQLVQNPVADLAEEDLAIFPAWDLVDVKKYYSRISLYHPVATVLTARGCPHHCTFCPEVLRSKAYQRRKPELVVEEIEKLKKDFGVKEIIFYDDTFTINNQHTEDICRLLLKKNLKLAWSCRTRVDSVNPSLLKLMAEAGCHCISYGVECGTDKALKTLKKGITVEQAKQAIQWTIQERIKTLAYFMIGVPGETYPDIQATLELAKDLHPDMAYFSIATGFPGTLLYEQFAQINPEFENFWEEFIVHRGSMQKPFPTLNQEDLNFTSLTKILREAYRDFYFRFDYLKDYLQRIKSYQDLHWRVRLALAYLLSRLELKRNISWD